MLHFTSYGVYKKFYGFRDSIETKQELTQNRNQEIGVFEGETSFAVY
jgi:hypothetical protein